MKQQFERIGGSEMKIAALWVVWCFFALFVVIALFAKPDITSFLIIAACVLHYLLRYERTGV